MYWNDGDACSLQILNIANKELMDVDGLQDGSSI